MNRRLLTIIAIFLGGIVLIIAGYLLWQSYSSSTFIISAPQNANIFVKQDSETFKEIGKTNATYKSRSKSTVFFEARLNDQVSQKSYSPQGNSTTNVNLDFKPLVNAQPFANGALTNLFIENGFVYGINANTNSLTASPILPSTSVAPNVLLLPFLKQAIWKNSTNYYAVTLGRGTQVIENNKILDGNLLPYSSIAVGKSNSVLLGKDGYYFAESNNLNKTKKLTDLKPQTEPQVFADNTYLYTISLVLNKTTNEDEVPTGKESNFIIYDQNGTQKFNITLPIKDQIYKIIALDSNNVMALTNNQLLFINLKEKSITPQDFSFGQVKDMVVYKNKILLLGSGGLWEYDNTSKQYSKVATYPTTQEYVPYSLTVLSDNLFFSARATAEAIKNKTGPTVANNIYKVSF